MLGRRVRFERNIRTSLRQGPAGRRPAPRRQSTASPIMRCAGDLNSHDLLLRVPTRRRSIPVSGSCVKRWAPATARNRSPVKPASAIVREAIGPAWLAEPMPAKPASAIVRESALGGGGGGGGSGGGGAAAARGRDGERVGGRSPALGRDADSAPSPGIPGAQARGRTVTSPPFSGVIEPVCSGRDADRRVAGIHVGAPDGAACVAARAGSSRRSGR